MSTKPFDHVLLEAALDGAFVESEKLQVSSFGDPDAGLREACVHFGVSRKRLRRAFYRERERKPGGKLPKFAVSGCVDERRFTCEICD